MEHFPVVCPDSHCVTRLTIANNDGHINVSSLTHMWGYFQSREHSLPSNSLKFYNETGESLFEEFVKHKYAQILCFIVTEPNDEKGITLIKNKNDYISLDIANRSSFSEVVKNMCRRTKRVLIIELFVCEH